MFRYNCFLCDYDMCDNCAQKVQYPSFLILKQIENYGLPFKRKHAGWNCSLQSRRGRVQEDKRMAYIYTHGLFIT